MVRIRLTRVGAKKQPVYRIIVTDGRRPRDTRYIEVLGYYNPRTRPSTEVLDEARALYWLSNGAQPSESVANIFNRLGTMARLERLRQGESLEALAAEAAQNVKALPDQRTNYPSPSAGQGYKKAKGS
jgi:small subunit ribosomal protein S16